MTFSSSGGFGPWVVSNLRRRGISSEDVWTVGSVTRWFFAIAAKTWALLPVGVRRRSAFQLVEMMSIRLHHRNLSKHGFSGLSGIMRGGFAFVTIDAETLVFNPKSSAAGSVGLRISPSVDKLSSKFLQLASGHCVVSGGTDGTFPEQWDQRKPKRSIGQVDAIVRAVKEAGIPRWYAQNLTSYDPLFSPLPGGVSPSSWRGSVVLARTRPQRDLQRNLVLCAHRRRQDPQWNERRKLTALAQGLWRDFVTSPSLNMDIISFRNEVRAHAFTSCVEGGGIDPSPKAYEALMQGSIPVIKNSPVADAYRHTPVLIVDQWEQGALSREFLEQEELRIREDWPDWFEVLSHMTLAYWQGFVTSHRDT
jgi:hypothetical protein